MKPTTFTMPDHDTLMAVPVKVTPIGDGKVEIEADTHGLWEYRIAKEGEPWGKWSGIMAPSQRATKRGLEPNTRYVVEARKYTTSDLTLRELEDVTSTYTPVVRNEGGIVDFIASYWIWALFAAGGVVILYGMANPL